MKRFIVASCMMVGVAAGADAACPSYPYNLTNGTNADANQVMGNFNNVLTCANTLAPLASPHFTGSVGIGTATPGVTLDVIGAAAVGGATERLSLNSGSIGFNREVTTGVIYTPGYAYQLQHQISTTATADYLHFQVYSPAGAGVGDVLALSAAQTVSVGTAQTSYNFYVNGSAAGTGGWINASDARLKKNVVELTGALDLVRRLRGVRFDWRESSERSVGRELKLPTGEHQIGFLAQDVEKIVPEAVARPRGDKGIYGVNEGALIPILVEAIKEQQVEIEHLKALIEPKQPATH